MKYFILLALLMTSVYTFAEDSKVSEKDMIGTWSAAYKTKKIVIKLMKDNKLELDEGRNKALKGTYKLDLKSKPHCLEMTIEGKTKYAIFEFTGKDTFKMDRPASSKAKEFGKAVINFTKDK